jgi:hypothetical protein
MYGPITYSVLTWLTTCSQGNLSVHDFVVSDPHADCTMQYLGREYWRLRHHPGVPRLEGSVRGVPSGRCGVCAAWPTVHEVSVVALGLCCVTDTFAQGSALLYRVRPRLGSEHQAGGGCGSPATRLSMPRLMRSIRCSACARTRTRRTSTASTARSSTCPSSRRPSTARPRPRCAF